MSEHSTANNFHATHFGFTPVDEAQKESKVQAVFDRVANRYDLMNDAMSAGVHHHWKDRLMDTLRPTPEMHLLDVAGGTGDVAFRFLARGGAHATVCDLNEEMLKVGQARAIDRNLDASRLRWVHGNAEALPFSRGACHSERSEESLYIGRNTSASPQYDNTLFDAYTISFGIRNVTHLDKALAEAYRVLKRGGRFLCLEFSTPPNAWLRRAYDAYSMNVIPKMGGILTNDEPSYQYLVESIRQFPAPDDFAGLISAAGFERVSYQRLSAGVVAIHSGWKL